MRLWLSGIAGKQEFEMADEAGAIDLLVDPLDERNVPPMWGGCMGLDNGAYRYWKKGVEFDWDRFTVATKARPGWAFIIAPDYIGEPEATWRLWKGRCAGERWYPVWHWGAPKEYLTHYLDSAERVCIGALVPLMRAKDEQMLAELVPLVAAHPGRFHVLGCNWIKAIKALRDLDVSIDTSKWLDAARYGDLIFVHAKTGALQQLSAKHPGLDKSLGCAAWDRRKRCVESARAMIEFCGGTR